MNVITPIPELALRIATVAHGRINQRRKYTDEPYIVHPIAVAKLVRRAGGTDEMIAAAYLHDVVEDTPVTLEFLKLYVGLPPSVITLVEWLTDTSRPEDGNRAVRKRIDRDRLAQAPAEAQTIKLADLVNNTSSIRTHAPDFWKVYRQEKLELLEVLDKGDADLWRKAKALCAETREDS